MPEIIGPVATFNPDATVNWYHFRLIYKKAVCYKLDGSQWSQVAEYTGDKVFYVYSPSEQKAMALILNREQQLLKSPLITQQSADQTSRFSNIFKVVTSANGVIWQPYPARASQYELNPQNLPELTIAEMQTRAAQIPKLPKIRSQAKKSDKMPVISITPNQALKRSRGMEFRLPQSLSEKQKKFIIQFLIESGDWPFSGKNSAELIQIGRDIINRTGSSRSQSTMSKYHDPLYLTKLMENNFYPTDSAEIGARATVSDVMIFIDVLVANSLRLLSYAGKINISIPLTAYNQTASSYLQEFHPTTNKRKRPKYSPAEKTVAGLVLDFMEGSLESLEDEIHSSELASVIRVLENVHSKHACVLHLNTELFTSICNLQGGTVDGDTAAEMLSVSCAAILNNLYKKQVENLVRNLTDFAATDNCSRTITQLVRALAKINEPQYTATIVESLSETHREQYNNFQRTSIVSPILIVDRGIFAHSGSSASSSTERDESSLDNRQQLA